MNDAASINPTPPLLQVEGLARHYRRGPPLARRTTFSLQADFRLDAPAVIGVLGPNGSGKTTLFELVTGSNLPDAGRVLVRGQDIHGVRTKERDRLAIHYHQSYQLRRFQRRKPDWMLDAAASDAPWVHLFDEPQFNTQDGYIGFMLDFFRQLRSEGRLVLLCLHPNERFHVEILREICEGFLFVHQGSVTPLPDFEHLVAEPRVRQYLGALAP
ncbi:ATP-binding cassette domain-containing protein [Aquincola sp. S2]|uniref:ATP-binding cassette domain-containing protein n=1 Tax=Pseudaquabacterium terrae TaxID=2732868 RepID=A0ABX2EQQ8_9BURK|nr:ATP-binding cassette domain-containing protein [Aquabacterium terrae]NRF70870.1 ATP-binding cassette domain-containing protein [Aquabacterium terrae]